MNSPLPSLSTKPADRTDQRPRRPGSGVRGALRDVVDRTRSGDLGLVPVVVGIIVIWTIFQVLNPLFLSGPNLVNLLMESVPVGVMALGIVLVLLVGQIDLSVGSMSGCAAAVLAVLSVKVGVPAVVAVALALISGAAVGWFYAQVYNRIGVPSFIITLAGLLSLVGAQLAVLGPEGTINLPVDSSLVSFAQTSFVPA